jgi:hypothetical protein
MPLERFLGGYAVGMTGGTDPGSCPITWLAYRAPNLQVLQNILT